MDMNYLFLGLIGIAVILITIKLTSVIKAKPDKETLLMQIMPIIFNTFVEIEKLYKANNEGFNALLEIATIEIKEQVNATTYLSDAQKEYLTTEVIKSYISDLLFELYSKKIQ